MWLIVVVLYSSSREGLAMWLIVAMLYSSSSEWRGVSNVANSSQYAQNESAGLILHTAADVWATVSHMEPIRPALDSMDMTVRGLI